MAKDFSFPFYVNDWVGGVMYFTFEQKGAYLELLVLQFNHGKFTESQVKQVLNTSYSSVWEVIKHKFKSDGTLFWNERMEIVKEERRLFVESRKNNRLGKFGKKKKSSVKQVKNTSVTSEKHLEGEGESIDNNIIVFEDFWTAYPKKKSKGDAENAWNKIKPDQILAQKILTAVAQQKPSIQWAKDGGQYIPYPASWLNAKGWLDVLDVEIDKSKLTITPDQRDKLMTE